MMYSYDALIFNVVAILINIFSLNIHCMPNKTRYYVRWIVHKMKSIVLKETMFKS